MRYESLIQFASFVLIIFSVSFAGCNNDSAHRNKVKSDDTRQPSLVELHPDKESLDGNEGSTTLANDTDESQSKSSRVDHEKLYIKSGYKIYVYYFHGHARCATCLQIEANTVTSVQSKFNEELKSGTIQLQVVNIQEPGNEHFSSEYNLAEQTVVIALYEGNEQITWKKLEKVWDYVWDEERFASYIQEELIAMSETS